MTRDYVVTTIAGSAGHPGTIDGTGTAARFSWNSGIDTDSQGNIYTVDAQAHTVRKITPAGVVTTLAGLANSAGSTDGAGSDARFSEPWGLTVAPDDNVYVCELGNNDIRKITPSGVVTTLAGLAGSPGFVDGAGSAARFSQPYGVASDFKGNIFVADYANRRIRKVTPAGVVTTVAGTGATGWTDGLGSVATFAAPSGLEFRRDGKAYVLDKDRVRLMSGAAAPLPDTHTWTGLGMDGKWSTPANWSTDAAPESGDSLIFSGATGLATVNDIDGLSIKDVTFSSSGFDVSGQPVTLSGTISCAAGSATTWGPDTTLGGDVAISMPGGWLTVTGDVSLGSTAHTLTVTTAGQVQFDGAVSGGAAGGTAIAKQGSGVLKLMNDGSWAGGSVGAGRHGALLRPAGARRRAGRARLDRGRRRHQLAGGRRRRHHLGQRVQRRRDDPSQLREDHAERRVSGVRRDGVSLRRGHRDGRAPRRLDGVRHAARDRDARGPRAGRRLRLAPDAGNVRPRDRASDDQHDRPALRRVRGRRCGRRRRRGERLGRDPGHGRRRRHLRGLAVRQGGHLAALVKRFHRGGRRALRPHAVLPLAHRLGERRRERILG